VKFIPSKRDVFLLPVFSILVAILIRFSTTGWRVASSSQSTTWNEQSQSG